MKKKVTFQDIVEEEREKQASAFAHYKEQMKPILLDDGLDDELWRKATEIIKLYIQAIDTHIMAEHSRVIREVRDFHRQYIRDCDRMNAEPE